MSTVLNQPDFQYNLLKNKVVFSRVAYVHLYLIQYISAM